MIYSYLLNNNKTINMCSIVDKYSYLNDDVKNYIIENHISLILILLHLIVLYKINCVLRNVSDNNKLRKQYTVVVRDNKKLKRVEHDLDRVKEIIASDTRAAKKICLINNMINTDDDRLYTCNKCGTSFTNSWKLRIHFADYKH